VSSYTAPRIVTAAVNGSSVGVCARAHMLKYATMMPTVTPHPIVLVMTIDRVQLERRPIARA